MKKHIVFVLIIGFFFSLLIGCVQPQPPLYHWGNYINSSANYGMNGHEKEVMEKHILELETIINESEAKNQRVAPGIYAEYAQLLYETNKKEEAKKYFALEKQTYPESTKFINGALTKLYGDES
jgi:hypothetical protein